MILPESFHDLLDPALLKILDGGEEGDRDHGVLAAYRRGPHKVCARHRGRKTMRGHRAPQAYAVPRSLGGRRGGSSAEGGAPPPRLVDAGGTIRRPGSVANPRYDPPHDSGGPLVPGPP